MFKLKHFYLVQDEELDSLRILKEVFGFDKLNKIQQLFKFRKLILKLAEESKRIEGIDFKNIVIEESSGFRIPKDIDMISYGARQEINQLLNIINEDSSKYAEVAATMIAIACYEEVYKEPFDENFRFRQLRLRALDLPIVDAIGMANLIIKKVNESFIEWGEKFDAVSIVDPDFAAAGGHILNRFNIVQVLKFICKAFNVNDKEAWKMSFVVVQMALWESQSSEFVQDKMTKIKERKLKAQQGR